MAGVCTALRTQFVSPTCPSRNLVPLKLGSTTVSSFRRLPRAIQATVQQRPKRVESQAVTMAAIAKDSSPMETAPKPFGVLFVCLGNICRSPSAEAVFRDVVEKRKLESFFNIDSAGTINYHEGNPADARMKSHALKRGVKLTSISRPIRPSDFEEFDLILAMDKSNLADILLAYDNWNRRSALSPNAKTKVKLMCSYCTKFKNVDEVPDPYYGGPEGFEKVLDLLEDACEGLLASIQELQGDDGKVNMTISS